MSSELNDIHNDMASQVFDVTIPLNFLVTEAGQLKVHSSYIGDKCFFFPRYEPTQVSAGHLQFCHWLCVWVAT
jgi:hypothetical protein